MKDILDKLKLIESEKPKAALLNKKFSSFRDMEQLQGDAKITTAHKPVKMGDKQKGLTGKLVGTSEAVENTVEDLVAKLGSEFKSQYLGDKTARKDRDLSDAPADKEIGKKKPSNDIVPKSPWWENPDELKKELGAKDLTGSAKSTVEPIRRDSRLAHNWPLKLKERGVSESSLNEFAPGSGDDGEEETLHKYARMWYNGDESTQQQVEQILNNMGWEIGELESEEGGAFVVQVGDEHGDSYIGFAVADLTEGMSEGSQRVDSLVTDSLKLMRGPELADAVQALKTVLGDREFSSRRGHYNFFIRQMMDMYRQQNVEEGLGDDEHRAFKRQELQHELGHESNNIQVVINGKKWKVFAGKGYADSPEEYRHLQSMKAWAAKKSAATGKKWEVYLTGSPVSESINEGVEMDMDSASPIGSMPADDIPQVQHVTEDWGSSDWHPVMKGMWDVIDRHYAGRANPESIEDAAQNAAEFYYDDMGYDDVEEAKDRIIGMFLRRPDGIGRKQEKTPDQELEEAGVVPTAAPASPEAAGLQGQLNIKQLASILPGIDSRQLGMAIATLKGGNEPSMVQQKALAGAFAALVKADPQTTSKAMAVLKKVSSDTTPAPAPTAPVGTPAAAPAAGAVPAKESEDYIKENKRK